MPEEEWQQEDDVTAISIREFADHKEEWVAGRFELIRGRMDDLIKEDMTGFLGERFLKGTALFLHDTLRVFDLKQAQILDGLSFARQKALHDRLYQAPLWDTLPPWPQQAERESPDALFLGPGRAVSANLPSVRDGETKGTDAGRAETVLSSGSVLPFQ